MLHALRRLLPPVLSPILHPVLPAALALLMSLACAAPAQAQTTLLVPSRTSIEEKLAVPSPKELQAQQQPQERKGQDAPKDAAREELKPKSDAKPDARPNPKAAPGQAEEAPAEPPAPPLSQTVGSVLASILAAGTPEVLNEEIDLLIAGMEPASHKGIAMDMPRIFTIQRFDRDAARPDQPASRQDLLGDIEEIRYLDQKAWGANVGIARRGLYHFSIETRPWWDAQARSYQQQIVKTIVPVYGEDWGWHLPSGLSFEIVPLVRPFGLTAPAFMAARVLVDGKPAPGLEVEIQRIGTEARKPASPWQEAIAARTLESGDVACVLNEPGWWCIQASRQGSPLKGPDGEPSPLRVSTVFWLYVDARSAR
ncbi:MAG: DUF4198 domain-containing protein [Desulfovibrio sp.]|nr:DUF4198 domain-containing protein [Desulfovibrio sp.]